MRMIEIAPRSKGQHRNQTYHGFLPDGWALVPDNLETENFPFGEVTVENMGGRMVVATWTPGEVPEPAPSSPTPSAQDDTDAMLVDHEYRITLLELGLTE